MSSWFLDDRPFMLYTLMIIQKCNMGRPKKDPTVMHSFRIKPDTAESLKQVAIECGFQHGDGAAMGEFLDRLAEVDRQLLKLVIKKT